MKAGLDEFGFSLGKKRKMREPHGQPEVIGSIIGALFFIGGFVVLACTTWAWAIGVNVVHGIIAGAVIGVILATFFGLLIGSQRTLSRRRGFGVASGGCIIAPLLLFAIIGALVGIFTQ